MSSNRIWAFGTAFVLVAVLALGWLLGISPLLTRAGAADTEGASVQAANQAQLATLEVMRAQFEDLDALQKQLDVLRASVPANVDSDFIYTLLAGYQSAAQAPVNSIVTGEAVPYGTAEGGAPVAEPAPTGDAQSPGSAQPDTGGEANGGSGGEAVAGLFTVPVTISFQDVPSANVMAFVAAMQRGPRIFLVTSVTATEGEGGKEAITVTAFMFVMSDPGAPMKSPDETLLVSGYDSSKMLQPLGTVPGPAKSPTPQPKETAPSSPTPAP